jgi:hypothetical protein
VYAYEWLRFHDSNQKLRGIELPSYLVEAMAIVPYFSGAKGIVLWGWEPQVKAPSELSYKQLPNFIRSLKRVARLSTKIARGQLLIDQPASAAWKERKPLIRKIVVDDNECVVMVVNPWQSESSRTFCPVRCGKLGAEIRLDGRHVTLAVLNTRGIRLF